MNCPYCDNEYSESWRVQPLDDDLPSSEQRVQCDCCGQWMRRNELDGNDFANEKIISVREIDIA